MDCNNYNYGFLSIKKNKKAPRNGFEMLFFNYSFPNGVGLIGVWTF